ncbi:MAG: 3-dehydroquinate synthase, partial [Bacteroidota bacterium]
MINDFDLSMTILELKDYNIYIGQTGRELSEIIENGHYSKVAILADENTDRLCLPVLAKKLNIDFNIIKIPAGEIHKNLNTCRYIWEQMMLAGMDRHSLLINLGGGVAGDMGGFCAATFLRGIDFIQVPTTLLSQVDASVGGKLGIDFNLIKNSVGVFKNPQAVFVDPEYLKTLPYNEVRSGFAEVFKHALIADADLWNDLQTINDFAEVDWSPVLARSLRIKKAVVEKDPFEKGLRKALNFGHTVGHAVETFSLKTDQPLLHGEAIAIGMVCESWLSHVEGNLSEKALNGITDFIKRIYPSYIFEKNNFSEIMGYMKKDKKNRSGKINFRLL